MTSSRLSRRTLALVVLSGCLAAATAMAQAPADAPAACFPATIDGFETAAFPAAQVEQLKSYRHSVAAGYNAAGGTVVTVFVYDRDAKADDQKEARAAIGEVLASHRGAELAMAGEGKVPLAGVDTPALGGMLLWTEGGADFGSFLWVVPRGGHYVKLRATYVRPPDDADAVAAMRSAMDALTVVARRVCDPG